MSYTANHDGAAILAGQRFIESIGDASNEVTAVIESPRAARDAREALIADGFADAAIHITAGSDIPRAMRHGGFLFAVTATTRSRRAAAANVLVRHGAHSVSAGKPY